MASRDENEREMEAVVSSGLRGWLTKARDAVMRPFKQFRSQPDPAGVFQVEGQWQEEVATIVTRLGRIADRAWNETTGRTPAVSRHAFVMSQLAQTENFLVRIPDEVYHLVFAEIADAVNAGASLEQVAAKVDQVLDWTSSENWPNRARVIARTEVTRAMNAGVQGAGAEMARVTGRILTKTWRAHNDDRTRTDHHLVDGRTVPFYQPFPVGAGHLMFPGDPNGPADEVINCRCSMTIGNEVPRG
jgi:uncharacterized protein with gpF-like domain